MNLRVELFCVNRLVGSGSDADLGAAGSPLLGDFVSFASDAGARPSSRVGSLLQLEQWGRPQTPDSVFGHGFVTATNCLFLMRDSASIGLWGGPRACDEVTSWGVTGSVEIAAEGNLDPFDSWTASDRQSKASGQLPGLGWLPSQTFGWT